MTLERPVCTLPDHQSSRVIFRFHSGTLQTCQTRARATAKERLRRVFTIGKVPGPSKKQTGTDPHPPELIGWDVTIGVIPCRSHLLGRCRSPLRLRELRQGKLHQTECWSDG